MTIETLAQLRALFPQPSERALKKQLDRLDAHCRNFIGLSPFCVLASVDAQGNVDASPRGGKPGFVTVVDERTLYVPDSPGNNRIDSLSNIVATGRVGMIFMIPGVDETLRVNGAARLRNEPDLLERFRDDKRAPRVVIEVSVREAYLHCAKAFMRSQLWSDASRIDRERLPSLSQMIRDQTGLAIPAETREQMLARYALDL